MCPVPCPGELWGPVLTEGGATLCVWRDREDIAGLPVPPSGRKERLQGTHPWMLGDTADIP